MKILAVIVSFNSKTEICEVVDSIIEQVTNVLIVDNNSSAETVLLLKEIEKREHIKVHFNDKNYGIAQAINIAINQSLENKYDYLLTLDQDSICSSTMVEKLLSVKSDYENIAMIAPQVVDRRLSGEETENEAKLSYVTDYAISSGAMFNVAAIKVVGLQRADFFIDAVDFEYSLRIRSFDFKIVKVPSAKIYHALGKRKQVRFLHISTSIVVHPAWRRYYMYRNEIILSKLYFMKYPMFILKRWYFLAKFIFQIILFESKKVDNLKNCLLGVWHGLTNKMGKRDD